MSDRFSLVNQETFENTLFSRFPIIPEKSRIMFDNQGNTLVIQFQFLNISDKIVDTVYLNVTCMDAAREVISSDVSHILTMSSAGRGVSFGERVPLYLTDFRTKYISFVITKIVFEDGTIWENKNNFTGKQVPAAKSLAFTDELQTQLLKEAQNIGVRLNCQFEEKEGYWRCSCGALNENETCYKCGKIRKNLRELFSESYLKRRFEEDKAAELKRQFENAKKLSDSDSLEDVQKALSDFESLQNDFDVTEWIKKCNSRIAEIEAEIKASEERKEQEREAQRIRREKEAKKAKKLKRRVAIIGGIVAFIAAAGMLYLLIIKRL